MVDYIRGNQRVKGNKYLEGEGFSESSSLGTVGSGVTAVHSSGDSKKIITTLTLSGISLAIAGAAAEATGHKVFTFPAGYHLHKVTKMNVTLTGTGTVNSDTPECGVGSVKASGAVAVLSGTATFEDYITGQVATDCNGTAIAKMTAATAGALTGISVNESGDTKTMHLNIADLWAGADTITLAGEISFEWSKL